MVQGRVTARGLLLTVLGELVLPAGRTVWTSALLTVLGDMGVGEKSARQAIMRTAAAGWMTPERAGRQTRWHLSDAGRALLVEGTHRIHEHAAGPHRWDRRWLVLLLPPGNEDRELRHRLSVQLAWAGLGSPTPGVWVTPHASRQRLTRAVLEDLGVLGSSWSFIAEPGAMDDHRALAQAAWDLEALGHRYDEFLRAFGRRRPSTPRAALIDQLWLVHTWRDFPASDPRLPRELAPPGWCGERAAVLFRERHHAWGSRAQGAWADICGSPERHSA